MRRRRFMFLMAAMAGLFAVAWGGSYWRQVSFGVMKHDSRSHTGWYEYYAGLNSGQLMLYHCVRGINSLATFSWEPACRLPEGRYGTWGFAAMSSRDSNAVGNEGWTLLGVPLWSGVAIPGVAGFVAWRRGRGKVPGACARCGYELRATPDRCPECGEAAVGGGKQSVGG